VSKKGVTIQVFYLTLPLTRNKYVLSFVCILADSNITKDVFIFVSCKVGLYINFEEYMV